MFVSIDHEKNTEKNITFNFNKYLFIVLYKLIN